MRSNLTLMARTLRKTSTDAEKLLWSRLRDRRLVGMKFRRQRPIGKYIVDFVCIGRKLVVEADGSQHFNNPDDIARDAYMREQGYTVLRFWNWDIMRNIDGVLDKIVEVTRAPSP